MIDVLTPSGEAFKDGGQLEEGKDSLRTANLVADELVKGAEGKESDTTEYNNDSWSVCFLTRIHEGLRQGDGGACRCDNGESEVHCEDVSCFRVRVDNPFELVEEQEGKASETYESEVG